ncbi:MAG: hypothetical protein QXD13_00845 [Candidatus Pacearchaeota archaeon]
MAREVNKVTEEEILSKEEALLAKSEISLILDNYNDIFSSFDPRPYSQRALSVDFLDEAKRATREARPGEFELRFLLPLSKRKTEVENTIKKRLKEHFKRHHEILEKDRGKIVRQGIYFICTGLIFMFVAAYILFAYQNKGLFLYFLVVLLEPGSWFLFWEGLDLIIFEAKKVKPDLEFYRKMVNAEIVFHHY